jgi:hypothetical protein
MANELRDALTDDARVREPNRGQPSRPSGKVACRCPFSREAFLRAKDRCRLSVLDLTAVVAGG